MHLLSFIRSPRNYLLNLHCNRQQITAYSTLLLCLLLPSKVFSFDDSGIEVSGQGSVIVMPDQFLLTLTITERGRVPTKLKALVDKKSNSVVNAAKSLSVKEENITSARVNLRIVKEKPSIQVQGIEVKKARQGSVYIDGQSINQQTSNVNEHKRPLFELSRQITVKFNKIDEYDKFLTQIIKINVSHISSLSMSVEGRDEYYQQALLKAIKHAKQKAQRMAKQAGRKIEKLQFIREQSSNHYRPMYAEAMMSDASPRSHTSLTGSQTITASVSVKFSLKD